MKQLPSWTVTEIKHPLGVVNFKIRLQYSLVWIPMHNEAAKSTLQAIKQPATLRVQSHWSFYPCWLWHMCDNCYARIFYRNPLVTTMIRFLNYRDTRLDFPKHEYPWNIDNGSIHTTFVTMYFPHELNEVTTWPRCAWFHPGWLYIGEAWFGYSFKECSDALTFRSWNGQ